MNLKELLRFEMITELCLFVWNAADMATVFQELITGLFHIILASTVVKFGMLQIWQLFSKNPLTVYYSISYWPPLFICLSLHLAFTVGSASIELTGNCFAFVHFFKIFRYKFIFTF